jgi:energy-converting hydrogenase Eha subunit C
MQCACQCTVYKLLEKTAQIRWTPETGTAPYPLVGKLFSRWFLSVDKYSASLIECASDVILRKSPKQTILRFKLNFHMLCHLTDSRIYLDVSYCKNVALHNVSAHLLLYLGIMLNLCARWATSCIKNNTFTFKKIYYVWKSSLC